MQCQNIREVASRMLLKRWQLIPSNISEAWEELLGLAAFIMARRKAPMHVSAWCHVSGQARILSMVFKIRLEIQHGKRTFFQQIPRFF